MTQNKPHLFFNSGEDWKILQPQFVVAHLLTGRHPHRKIKGNAKTQRRKVWRQKGPGGGVGDMKRSQGHRGVLMPEEGLQRSVFFPSFHFHTEETNKVPCSHHLLDNCISLSQIFDCKPSTLLFLGLRFCFACHLHVVKGRTFYLASL